MNPKPFFLLTLLLVFFISTTVFAQQEEITLSTYYPAPYGEYDELCAEKLLVWSPISSELARMGLGDCHIGNSLIVGAGGGGFSYKEISGTLADGTVLIKGDVGIGTTTPGTLLDGSGSAISGPLLVDIVPGSKVGGFVAGGSRTLDAATLQRQGYFLRRNDSWCAYNDGLWTGSKSSGTESEYWENVILGAQGGGANLVFMTGPTQAERMRITTGGNVGIGTTNPGSFLDSSGNQVTSLLLDMQPGTSQPGGIIVGSSGRTGAGTTRRQGYFLRRSDNWNSYPSGLWKGSDTSGSEYWENLVINNSGGGANIIFMTNLAERMRIQADGNAGIGTTSPGQKLTVAGTIETTSGGVKFPDGTTQTTAAAGFGSWTSISAHTIYRAATDGFVMVRGYFRATNGYIVIKTDGSADPQTTRQSKGGTNTIGDWYIYSVMCPVRKGDYYKVETRDFITTGSKGSIYWLPIGA